MAIRDPDLPILHGVLQVHVAGGKPPERLRSGMRQIDYRELVQTRELVADLLPPQVSGTAAVSVHEHMTCAAAGFAHAFLIWQTDVNPGFDVAREILAPQVGFIVCLKPAPKLSA